MTDGIDITRLDDGTVRIVATAGQRSVRMRVTAEYARDLAAKLEDAALGPERDTGPLGMFDEWIKQWRRR